MDPWRINVKMSHMSFTQTYKSGYACKGTCLPNLHFMCSQVGSVRAKCFCRVLIGHVMALPLRKGVFILIGGHTN